MPNYVMNTISAPGIGKLPILSLENGEKKFDFEKLIPVPESLKQLPEKPTSLQLENRDKLICDYWGANENAVHCHIGMNEISFLTIGGAPTPVIRSLAAKYPVTDFVHSYLFENVMETIFIDFYKYGELVESKHILNPYYQIYTLEHGDI